MITMNHFAVNNTYVVLLQHRHLNLFVKRDKPAAVRWNSFTIYGLKVRDCVVEFKTVCYFSLIFFFITYFKLFLPTDHW